jgi:hypothetical protein
MRAIFLAILAVAILLSLNACTNGMLWPVAAPQGKAGYFALALFLASVGRLWRYAAAAALHPGGLCVAFQAADTAIAWDKVVPIGPVYRDP